MRSHPRLLFVLLAPLFSLLACTAFAQSLPKPAGRITDLAGVIDAATESDLDRRIDHVEQKTSSEIAVATVESLGGISVEEYANRLFKEWGVGQAKQDNGVLVLIAPNEREMRIEVGYGLEGVLPDGLAGQVIREQFTPRFRDGDYSRGISDGVTRIADIIEKHQVLTPEELAKFNESDSEDVPVFVLIPFLGLFVAIGFGMLGVGLRTRTIFPVLFGSFFGGMPLLMSLIVPMTSLVTLFPLAAGMTVLGYRLGGRKSWRDTFRDDGKGGGSSSGWTMGANSSSSGSSGSSSSSSSFGGGSSGGGGASGRW